MFKFHLAVLLGASVSLISAETPAAVYKWRDQSGTVHYSEQAPPGQSAESVAVPPSPEPAKTVTGTAPAREPTPTAVTAKPTPTLPAQQREELCQRARDQYSQLESTPRVFRQEADGSRVRLSEEERQSALAHEQELITKYCQ